MANHELATWFFLQLTVILAVAHAMGWAATRIGQPRVMGEMIAGVLLGPSLFGWLAPEAAATLFPRTLDLDGHSGPHPLMGILYTVAQIGIALYMFCVGANLDLHMLRENRRTAAAVSVAGMIVPFAVGCALAWMFSGPERDLFAPDASLARKMLFMGAAMAVTAFPMLARIIQERGLEGTAIGTLTLSAGAAGDAVAWCLLAVVLAGLGTGSPSVALTAGGGLALGVLLLGIVRPLLRRLFAPGGTSQTAYALVALILLAAAAAAAEFVGIHAVMGAFLAGAALPRTPATSELVRKIDPLTSALLVPIFFVFSGLNTRLTMVDSWPLWGLAALVFAAACVGKLGACYAAARLCGEPRRESWAIGSLMNARGLMELILLNLGLQHGLITPRLFSIMVLMAIVTTFMATPLFEWGYGRHARATGKLGAV